MDKFEYKLVKFSPPLTFSQDKGFHIIEEQLNSYGKDGWELCFLETGTIYFKRKLDN